MDDSMITREMAADMANLTKRKAMADGDRAGFRRGCFCGFVSGVFFVIILATVLQP